MIKQDSNIFFYTYLCKDRFILLIKIYFKTYLVGMYILLLVTLKLQIMFRYGNIVKM